MTRDKMANHVCSRNRGPTLKSTAGDSFFERGRKLIEAYETETCLFDCFSRPQSRMGLTESHLEPPGNQNEKTRINKTKR